MANQNFAFIFGCKSKWPFVLPAVGKHLYHGVCYSKTQLPAWKQSSLSSLCLPFELDCIASYKLSMVHKLCCGEHNAAWCWDTCSEPPSHFFFFYFSGWDLLWKLCNKTQESRENTKKKSRNRKVLIMWSEYD